MKLVSRSEWGARAPSCTAPLPPVDAIAFHYTAADADEQADHANCAARVRGIQRFHIDTQGWCDIAYNFVVCKHGFVFVGRGFYRSGATGDDNSHTIAVCFLGDDTQDRDDLTDLGRAALVDAARFIQERLNKRLAYNGHRDYMSTACPGNEIYNYVNSAAFAAKVNGEEPDPDDMTRERVLEIESLARRYDAAGRVPGTAPDLNSDAETAIFYAVLRSIDLGRKDAEACTGKLKNIDAIIHA